ncbi:MAG: GDSL-type esterase/lipase family protein [Bacilli bacterium]
MQKPKILALITTSTIATVVAAIGFYVAIDNTITATGNKPNEDALRNEEVTRVPSRFVMLGDSLTRGIGDESGEGYAGKFVKQIETRTNESIQLTNLAVSGATTADLLTQLQSPGVQYTVRTAGAIVLTIGGNDLFPGAEALATMTPDLFLKPTEQFSKDVPRVLGTLRELNPDAPIYWLALYNPFETITQLKQASPLVQEWNNILAQGALQHNDVYVVPTFDLFQGTGKSLLYSDVFHPNTRGYALMADRLADVVIEKREGEPK